MQDITTVVISKTWEIVGCWRCGFSLTYGDTAYRTGDNGPLHCCEACARKTLKKELGQ